jgi:hypothetical protein
MKTRCRRWIPPISEDRVPASLNVGIIAAISGIWGEGS